jgi:probable rRNA maturation factor
MQNIYFFFQHPTTLRNRNNLKACITNLFKKEKQALESLNFVFTNDEELLTINQQYLKHDYYTDIITFDLAAKGQPTQGDVYISVERVKDNARQLGVSFYKELHRVIFHGALHLCGYGDKTVKEEKKMREMENKYLDLYFTK